MASANCGSLTANVVKPTGATSEIVIFFGSRSRSPFSPFRALVSTMPISLKLSVPLPDTSTEPPFPEIAPPRALMLPAKLVVLSDQTTTCPPLPVYRASALITES